MADEGRLEAIKEIQSVWTASIIVSIVWVLFLPSAIEQIKLYEGALDLTAWKLVRDFTSELPRSGATDFLVTGYVKNVPQTGFHGEEPPPYKYPLLGMDCVDAEEEGQHCDPLAVQSSWPEQRQIVIFLISTELLEKDNGFDGTNWHPLTYAHMRIVARSGALPLSGTRERAPPGLRKRAKVAMKWMKQRPDRASKNRCRPAKSQGIMAETTIRQPQVNGSAARGNPGRARSSAQ